MVSVSRDRRDMRAGFNRRPGRSNARCGRWRNRHACPRTFAIVRFRLAAYLLSLTRAGMRPVVAMRMTKRPQKSTERTSFDSIAEAQKPDDGEGQKQPRQQLIHAILSVWPRIFACMDGEELRHRRIYGRSAAVAVVVASALELRK